ncbi:Protein transport protein-like protein [Emericellopsis cladophorae]|uniref:Protein transport protein-like protein n=1 Tax=Emericellopsis cladophorae TaxID=2686198 RepID=A0A9P9Y1J6_9HYPO|nr:Protein transport protein-like protein [Emericellopsis cladophorae]KAI6781888.1 Protein transport protein-like protein [Emericellopsis cladophorae]
MSEAYERERQNNDRLSELSNKVSALRGVTVDIYDQASSQSLIDNTSETFSSMGTQMKGSAGRLTRMAASGNKVAIMKLAGICIVVFLVLYYGLKLIFGGGKS